MPFRLSFALIDNGLMPSLKAMALLEDSVMLLLLKLPVTFTEPPFQGRVSLTLIVPDPLTELPCRLLPKLADTSSFSMELLPQTVKVAPVGKMLLAIIFARLSTVRPEALLRLRLARSKAAFDLTSTVPLKTFAGTAMLNVPVTFALPLPH